MIGNTISVQRRERLLISRAHLGPKPEIRGSSYGQFQDKASRHAELLPACCCRRPYCCAVTTVIVPAHNEGRVIGRLLGQLVPASPPGEFDVIVVANGCTDDTAEVAASFGPRVRVLSIPVASKHAALVAADRTAPGVPRVYIDADVELRAAGRPSTRSGAAAAWSPRRRPGAGAPAGRCALAGALVLRRVDTAARGPARAVRPGCDRLGRARAASASPACRRCSGTILPPRCCSRRTSRPSCLVRMSSSTRPDVQRTCCAAGFAPRQGVAQIERAERGPARLRGPGCPTCSRSSAASRGWRPGDVLPVSGRPGPAEGEPRGSPGRLLDVAAGREQPSAPRLTARPRATAGVEGGNRMSLIPSAPRPVGRLDRALRGEQLRRLQNGRLASGRAPVAVAPVLYVDPPMSALAPMRHPETVRALRRPRLRLLRPGLARLTPVVPPFPSRPVTAGLTSALRPGLPAPGGPPAGRSGPGADLRLAAVSRLRQLRRAGPRLLGQG